MGQGEQAEVTMGKPATTLLQWHRSEVLGAAVVLLNYEHQKRNQDAAGWQWSGKRGRCAAWGLRTQAVASHCLDLKPDSTSC